MGGQSIEGEGAMIDIKRKEECCGCNACGDICPTGAISFHVDEEGFWYPEVNHDLCINCGLCEKTCPNLHSDALKKNDLEESVCYAAEHKNMEVIFDSTSGGLFSALADVVYRKHGFMGGAVFNEDMSVSQFLSAEKKDLLRLRSSKYLQSNAEGFYKAIRDLVKQGEDVLVCGTPCQMAALRAFLGRNYENLVIVDFICRGVNSPKIWQKYMKSFEERYGSRVVFAKAKSKEYGWRNLTQYVRLADGREFFETKDTSNFTKGYLHTNAYCRPSCYECQFKGFPRMADITLADFWGIEHYEKSLEKDIGTSLVMLNSKHGEEFFEQVKKRINCVPMAFQSILPGNPALVQPLGPSLVDRKQFFADVDAMTFGELAEKYINVERAPQSLKARVKNVLRPAWRMAKFAKQILQVTRCHPRALYQTLRYSGIRNLLHKRGILFGTHCVTNIAKDAHIECKGLLIFGTKWAFPSSAQESRLCIEAGGKLEVLGDTALSYGCDIEVFQNASLTFHGKEYVMSGSNIGLTIICGNRIEIGADVAVGRNVTIRDNNGDHYINRQGYKNSSPVIIGKKAWLCEACTLLSGAKIGEGAIVGAKSVVIGRVPARAMVFGCPAQVIDEEVRWKY